MLASCGLVRRLAQGVPAAARSAALFAAEVLPTLKRNARAFAAAEERSADRQVA